MYKAVHVPHCQEKPGGAMYPMLRPMLAMGAESGLAPSNSV